MLCLRNQRKSLLIISVVMLFVLSVLMTSTAFAAGEGDLVSKATAAKDKVVKLIQDLAKIAAVVFIGWAGIIFWGAGGDAQKMAAAKSKMLYFFISLFLIFGAEGIIKTILGLFE